MASQEDEFNFEDYSQESSQQLITTAELDYNPDRYRVIKPSDIMKRCKGEIAKVKAVTGDTFTDNKIRLLLNDYRWDVEKFLEKFYTDENFSATLMTMETQKVETPATPEVKKVVTAPKPAAGSNRRITRALARKREASGQLTEEDGEPKRKLQISALGESSQNAVKQEEPKEVEPTCDICFDPIGKNIHTWDCKHKFCRECFKSYLMEKITCNSLTAVFQCPGYKCLVVLNDSEIMKVLDSIHKDKYMHVITNQYVECKRTLRWCPGKNCTNAIEVFDTVNQPAVRCLCGNYFCFSCGHFGHDLLSCELVKKFDVMKSNDYASANWIAEYCKQCPKCRAEINKNGGCNHMSCTKCRHEFCWVCFDDWSTHMNRACTGARVDPKSETKVSTRKLVSCVSKYGNMIDSIKKDEVNYQKYIKVQEMKAAEETEVWYKVDFIKEATDWILKCRQLLCDSYILEFFFEDSSSTHWLSFEMSQRGLMTHTEGLSSLMEHDINGENMHSMKQKLETHVRCCKSLYNAVYEKAKEGFTYDLWKKD